MAKDFFDNELAVGDTVAFMQTGYRNLIAGTITKITDKMLVISHERQNVGGTETKQAHGQVIKKTNVEDERTIFNKVYHGFESWSDIDRDVSEMWDDADIPAEGQGKLTIKVTYVDED
jgi:hypothetical protein